MRHFNRAVLLCQCPGQWCHFKTVCIWEGDNNIFISFQIDNNWSQPNFYEFLNFYELKLLTLNTEIKVPVTSPAGLFGCDARIFHLWSFLYYCIRVHVSRPILSYQNSEQYHLFCFFWFCKRGKYGNNMDDYWKSCGNHHTHHTIFMMKDPLKRFGFFASYSKVGLRGIYSWINIVGNIK